MEWFFFTRTQRGEDDTAVYEVGTLLGLKALKAPLGICVSTRPLLDRTIRICDDVTRRCGISSRSWPPRTCGLLCHAHFHRHCFSRGFPTPRSAAALKRRGEAGPAERDIYASYIHEAFLTALEPHAERIVFQFSIAAEPMPTRWPASCRSGPSPTWPTPRPAIPRSDSFAFWPAGTPTSRLHALPRVAQLRPGRLLVAQLLSRHDAAGHGRAARHAAGEQADRFFSDAYSAEWTYAKATIVRSPLAQVLAQKVRQGQYTFDKRRPSPGPSCSTPRNNCRA